jgi:putative transposase
MDSVGRRHPARRDVFEVFNHPPIVFLTVCAKDKKRILASDAVHHTLREAWTTADSWLVGRYVVMPDHLHLFCSPVRETPVPLARWVAYWKSHASRHWPTRQDAPIWQANFWDTQLRRGESYDNKWQYVVENPVRAKLVENPTDWPYQGEIHRLIC